MLEDQASFKSEYCSGSLYALAGGSVNHNRLIRNLTVALHQGLQTSDCEVFVSDVRLHVESYSLFTYPDLMVACKPLQYFQGRNDTLCDAALLIEVLSPSTESYDRNDKFRFYRSLPSLQEYLTVSQNQQLIEHHLRQGVGTWLVSEQRSEVTLNTANLRLVLEAVYDGVDFS